MIMCVWCCVMTMHHLVCVLCRPVPSLKVFLVKLNLLFSYTALMYACTSYLKVTRICHTFLYSDTIGINFVHTNSVKHFHTNEYNYVYSWGCMHFTKGTITTFILSLSVAVPSPSITVATECQNHTITTVTPSSFTATADTYSIKQGDCSA